MVNKNQAPLDILHARIWLSQYTWDGQLYLIYVVSSQNR